MEGRRCQMVGGGSYVVLLRGEIGSSGFCDNDVEDEFQTSALERPCSDVHPNTYIKTQGE